MAHSSSPVTIKDVPAIVRAKPIALADSLRFPLLFLVIVGVLAFLQELMSDQRHAWTALQVNFTYWVVVAAASSGFAAVFHICDAQWARPISRLFESACRFLYVSPLFLVAIYFGHHHIFEWSHHEIAGKASWLSSNFLYARDIAALILLALLIKRLLYLTMRRDIGAIRSGLTGLPDQELARWKDKRYDRFVDGWGENAVAELEKTSERIGVLSPIIVVAYSLIMSLIAFDQIMSVDPHWYSTMFGGFYFMSGVYLCTAFGGIAAGLIRTQSPLFLAKIERRTLHDLGKLVFGFGIFWAYLFWSHYLPIWYGNIPEETGYMIVRLREQPWHDFAWMVLGACFIIPFFLGLSRDLKQVPAFLFVTGCIVAIGIWLQQYLLFAPTLYPDEIPLDLSDLLIALGFMGGYILSCVSYLAKVPLMPFGDLYQPEV